MLYKEYHLQLNKQYLHFLKLTKNNEIIYEVDFENDRVQEIHTNYNGEPESWGWNDNVKEQLSKVKPISQYIK